MFCPNCSQAFNAFGQPKCPTCGYHLGQGQPVRLSDATGSPDPDVKNHPTEGGSMEAGAISAVKLILIGIACFVIYKVLVSFYPAHDSLIPGTSGRALFETAGQAILVVLFAAGCLRALYAVTVERRRDLRRIEE